MNGLIKSKLKACKAFGGTHNNEVLLNPFEIVSVIACKDCGDAIFLMNDGSEYHLSLTMTEAAGAWLSCFKEDL